MCAGPSYQAVTISFVTCSQLPRWPITFPWGNKEVLRLPQNCFLQKDKGCNISHAPVNLRAKNTCKNTVVHEEDRQHPVFDWLSAAVAV